MHKLKFHKYQDVNRSVTLCKDIADLEPYDITLPEPPKPELIKNFGLPIEEQFYKREKPPRKIIELNKLPIKEALDFARRDDAMVKYIAEQWHKRWHGEWVYIRGMPYYITGLHWFYLNWYMQRGYFADFRCVDMREFQWWKFCVEDDLTVLGGINFTKRQTGKTFKAGCMLLEFVTSHPQSSNGIQSKSDDSASKFFAKAVVQPWRRLPFFFQPITSSSTSPKQRIEFTHAAKKGKAGDEADVEEALESWINYESSEETVYDGDTLDRHVTDEAGKFKMPASPALILDKITDCLIQDGKIRGKELMTTTVELFEKGGLKEFLKIWNKSNRFDKDGKKLPRTVSGLVRYFTPADHNMVIDQYGESVIGNPLPYQQEFLKRTGNPYPHMGGTEHINHLLKLQKTDTDRADVYRKHPLTIKGAFQFSNKDCHFNINNINKALEKYLYDNPYVKWGRLKWKDDMPDTEVIFVEAKEPPKYGQPTSDARMCIVHVGGDASPYPDAYRNKVKVLPNGKRAPVFEELGMLGSDTFKYDKVTWKNDASRGTGYVYMNLNPNIDVPNIMPENHVTDDFIAEYVFRPPTVDEYCEDMLMMAVYYSMKMFPENNIDHIEKHFARRGYTGYLKFQTRVKKEQGAVITKEQAHAGAYTGDGAIAESLFALMDSYLERNWDRCKFPRLLEDCRDVEYHNRQPYDCFMGSVYALYGRSQLISRVPKSEEEKKKSINIGFKTFRL